MIYMKRLALIIMIFFNILSEYSYAATPYTDTVMLKKANIKNDLLLAYLKNQLIPIVTKAVTEPIGIMLDIKSTNDSISTIVTITFVLKLIRKTPRSFLLRMIKL